MINVLRTAESVLELCVVALPVAKRKTLNEVNVDAASSPVSNELLKFTMGQVKARVSTK